MYGNELNAAGQPLYFPWERAKDRRRKQREALAKREAEKFITKEEIGLLVIYLCGWVMLTFIIGLTYYGVYHIVQPFTNYELMKPDFDDGEPTLAMFVYEVIAALCVYFFHAHSKSWIETYHSAVKRRKERRLAAAEAAAEAAAAELLADEPAPRDDARAGLHRRAPRGRRRERARGATPPANEPAPAEPESKPEPPAAPESKPPEEPPAAPEAKREEEETPAATGPPPGKKVLVDDDILDDAAAHARTLETSLTAHQAEVQRLKKILRQQQRDIPDGYLCPITMDPMEDPCIAADGHSYERRAIKDWFARGKRTSPKTGAQLDDTRLFPNHALKSAIQDFLEEVRRFDAATAGAQD